MKPSYSKHNSNSSRSNAARQDNGHISLLRMKAQCLSASASHQKPSASEVVQEFGFFPKGIPGVIVRWPTL